MGEFFTEIFNYLKDLFAQLLLPSFRLSDVLDILAIAFLVYEILNWIRRTRGWMLFRGILVVALVWLLAAIFQLNMVRWLFERAFSVGILAMIIIFQPEIRRALERIGTSNIFTSMFGFNNNTVNERTANSLITAMTTMAEAKTGALIAVEQKVALGEYEQTGIPVDAEVSSQLLLNIFEKNTPLHDGAVIIRQNRVLAATCYLPLSESQNIDKELGTRHRAAIGLSEVSDAKIFVVSEETGGISMAHGGKIYRDVAPGFIRDALLGQSDTDDKSETALQKSFLERQLEKRQKEKQS